jgi:hypothetical protein
MNLVIGWHCDNNRGIGSGTTCELSCCMVLSLATRVFLRVLPVFLSPQKILNSNSILDRGPDRKQAFGFISS